MTVGPDTAPASLANKIAAGAGGLVLLVAVIAAGAGAGIASLLGGGGGGGGGGGSAPSATATGQIPAAMLTLYQQAATTCPGLPWTVLAAIGTVESANGTSNLPEVHSLANPWGAEVIYGWDWAFRHVRHGGRWARACEVSTRCEARRAAAAVVGRHTRSIRCLTYDGCLSGLACGVSE